MSIKVADVIEMSLNMLRGDTDKTLLLDDENMQTK